MADITYIEMKQCYALFLDLNNYLKACLTSQIIIKKELHHE